MKLDNFRIPQPYELNLCDMCFQSRKHVYGSTFQGKHYTLCSTDCKNQFIKETMQFEKKIEKQILEKEKEFICSRCNGAFSKYRPKFVQDEQIFCSELCLNIFNGKINPFYWMKKEKT